jgi:hypothetical protein
LTVSFTSISKLGSVKGKKCGRKRTSVSGPKSSWKKYSSVPLRSGSETSGDVEAFELVEDREVGGVDLVAAVGRAGGDDAHRRLGVFHGADLHAGGVGAQEFAGVEIEGVLLVARRVVGGRVEGVETMELVLDFRAVGEGEAHAAEDGDGLVADQRERMERTSGQRRGRAG